MREHALKYAAKGWPVFPLLPNGKRPLTANGLHDATTNPVVIGRWWDRWPDANIGIAAGPAFGWVLDVDGAAGSASLTKLEEKLGPLPDTLCQATGGGGRHLIFAWPGREVRNRQDLLGKGSGIDVRGEGGYVVAPPSVHESGRSYSWEDEGAPRLEAPSSWVDAVAPVRAAVAPWERADPPRVTLPPVPSGVLRTPVLERAARYLRECDPAVAGQAGHNKLLWAARALVVGFDLSDEQALSLLWEEYNPRCNPPWKRDDDRDRRDFERKVGEARRTACEKPRGWLLDEYGLRSSEAALASIAAGAASAANLLAEHAAKATAGDNPIPADVAPKATVPEKERRDFPVDALPPAIRDFAVACAEAHNVDLSFTGLPILCVAGAAMGNAWRLKLKDGYISPPILWVALVGRSGTNKSGPLNEIVEPLRTVLTPDQIPEPMLNPQARQVVSDATLEAVVARLQESRRGLLIYRDELAGWTKSFNAYRKGGGGDEQAWLEFHGGKPYSVDRKTNNEQIYIPSASCSVLGGIQPKILRECFDPGRFASGLVPRILIACPPRRSMYWNDREVAADATSGWTRAVTWLRTTPFAGLDTNTGRFAPRMVRYSAAAYAAHVGFYNALSYEEDQTSDENHGALISKARGTFSRFALIHHGLRLACAGAECDQLEVDVASVEAAAVLTRWCLEEQIRVFGFASQDRTEEYAAELLAWIRERCPTPSATTRQIQRWNSRRYPTAQAAAAGLSKLVELGHARWAADDRDKIILTTTGVTA